MFAAVGILSSILLAWLTALFPMGGGSVNSYYDAQRRVGWTVSEWPWWSECHWLEHDNAAGDPVKPLPGWADMPSKDGSGAAFAYGVPWRCMRVNEYYLPGSAWYIAGKRLPLHIYLPGLLADAVFFALVSAGVSFVPIMIQRRRRARRNCCVACGYSRQGVTPGVCPECGNTFAN